MPDVSEQTFLKDTSGRTGIGEANKPVRVDPTGTTTQPVSSASLPLPAGAATEATLALVKAKTDNLDVLLSTRTKPADTQAISAASLPLPSGASQEHITAASPHSARFTDGAAFYDAAKTGQLPSALVGGRLDANVGAVGAGVTIEAVGDVAHDAVAAGNPVLTAGRANQNEPAAVADGDAVYGWRDQQGRSVAVLNFPPNVVAAGTHGPETVTLTLTTDAAIVAAPGAGQSVYVTSLAASNTSATKTRLDVKEGATIRVSMFLAADGGGFVMPFHPPWKLPANTALNGALGTGVTDVRVNVHYFVAP